MYVCMYGPSQSEQILPLTEHVIENDKFKRSCVAEFVHA